MKVNALKRGYKSAASFSVLSSLSSESSHSFLSPLLSHCKYIYPQTTPQSINSIKYANNAKK